ncbi:hypothetical protein A8C32_15890 [Flavivirga aquatica]|uniref:Uncharacterized protein n=1 Tax=Flavivirga aquatica TaxID=1849968 RepID=A0A1E5T986_9FLAO|nr:hypothetical protein A8C32_15890 [Flavivirga aquatica]
MMKKLEEAYISRRNNAFMVEKKTCALDTNNSRAHSPFQWVFKIENSKEMRGFLSSLKDSLQFLVDNSKVHLKKLLQFQKSLSYLSLCIICP